MATLIDPRQFEHPYISISDLCFLFQLKRGPLLSHLSRIGLAPARALNGELFGTGPGRFLYPASEVLFALPPSTRGIFLAWQRGDFILPAFNGADSGARTVLGLADGAGRHPRRATGHGCSMMIGFDEVTAATWLTLERITAAPSLLAKCLALVEANGVPRGGGASLSVRLAQEVEETAAGQAARVQWEFIAMTLTSVSATLSFSPESSSWTDIAETACRG